MLKVLDFHGNAFLGVLARTNERVTFLGVSLPPRQRREVEEALQTEIVPLTVGGGSIVGSLLAMNGRGALLADIATEDELAAVRGAGLRAERLDHVLNAAGNNVLANDRGALVHPDYDDGTVALVGEVLGVEVQRGILAGTKTVGMAAVATNAGMLLHPKTTEAEKAAVERLFGVEAAPGTVNHGVPTVGAGVVANTKGGLTGARSTGLEIGRAEDALRLY